MSRSVLAVVALGLMLVASSVPAQNTSKPATGTEIPDVTLPPELDRVLRDYERAWRAGDAAALASLFTEDGFILQSNRPPIRGRSANQAHYEDQGEGGPVRLRAIAFNHSSTNVYIIGMYSFTNNPNNHDK